MLQMSPNYDVSKIINGKTADGRNAFPYSGGRAHNDKLLI
jgi:hypothetical protein